MPLAAASAGFKGFVSLNFAPDPYFGFLTARK